MLPNYKVFVFFKKEYDFNSPKYIGWRKLSELKQDDIIYCFTNNKNYYGDGYNLFNSINFKGYISVYQFKEIEIKIPKNRKIIYISKFIDPFLSYKSILDYQIILYLLSSIYKNKYLLISEKVIIKFQKYFNFIYKNGKYIVENKILIKEIFQHIKYYRQFHYIYEIIDLNNSNKFYGNKEQNSLIEFLCKKMELNIK